MGVQVGPEYATTKKNGKPAAPFQILQKIITWSHQVCFISCIAFSGMRRSDAFELKSDSYADRILSDGTRVSVLNGKTHKMADGPGKAEEWVTAEITKKAIQIASLLSAKGREQALEFLANNLTISERTKFERMSTGIWLGYKGGVTHRSFIDYNYLIDDWNYRITPADLKEHNVKRARIFRES